MQHDLIEQLTFEQLKAISVKTDKVQAQRNKDAMQCVVETGMTPDELRLARESNERVAKDVREMLNE